MGRKHFKTWRGPSVNGLQIDGQEAEVELGPVTFAVCVVQICATKIGGTGR